MKNLIPVSAIPQWMIYILAILLSVQCAQAQERFVNALTGAQIVNNAVFTVSDDKFSSLPIAGMDSISLETRLILEIDEDALVAKNTSNISLTLSIKGWNRTYDTPSPTSETLTLNFTNTATGTSPHRVFRIWSTYHKLEVTITGVTYSGGTLPPLKLIGEILAHRKYAFATGTPPVPNNVIPSATAANFTWPSTAGAEEYDLEWTFFDAESSIAKNKLALGQTLTPTEVNDIFRFNATRVSTSNLQYTLPLTYSAGYILYRLRAARTPKNGFREYTGWSTYKSFAISTHEPTLNWQAQITFAEEGKMVPSVNYFDNTLRERQSVTLSNSIGMTLASATAYDHQGRPAFKTLMAPTFQTFLKFDPLLAANAAGTAAYGKAEFDINACTYAPPAMSSTLGVGKYFSPNNPNYLTGENAYIPDAKGFAYTITEYTADQTGRIRRQSAPGELFRMSGGKETKYFYGKPSQDELDRLLGNDAGDASHYQKNLVIDPNGQASVSYVDMHGRTVATALAGAVPSNVNGLGGSTTLSNFKQELLNNLKDEYTLTSNFNLLVPQAASYTFKYLISNAPVLNNLACAPSVCYDCAYDLRIQVLPACGGTPLLDVSVPNFTNVAEDDPYCGAPLATTSLADQVVALSAGEYTVIKTISINNTALNTYANIFLAQANCVPTLTSFKNQLQSVAYTAGCLQDCSNCISALQTNKANGVITQAEYDELSKECYERCKNSLSTCDAIKLMIEGDMNPGGQYAQFKLNGNTIESTDPVSIFYKQSPTVYNYQVLTLGDVYRNEQNQPDTVIINGVKTLPTNLTPQQFIENWKPSWAVELSKKYHPEYCYLNWCNNQTNSSRYEAKLLASETYQMAVDSGFITNGLPNFFTTDPFFATSEGLSCKTDLQARWNDVDPRTGTTDTMSVFRFVNRQVFGENCGTFGGTGNAVADKDAAWRMLRAIYLGLVAQCKGQKRAASTLCTNTTDLNCIGNPSCTTSPYASKERRVLNDDYRSQVSDPNFYTTNEATQTTALLSECNTFCDSTAAVWLEQLAAACPSIAALSTTSKNDLKIRLAAVCKSSCDATHPYGATTTPPGVTTSYGDASFESVVTAFIGASQAVCSSCHANIISFPGTYTVPAYNSARTVESRVNTCACENYKVLKDCYTATPGNYSTFTDYLKQFSEVPLSATDMALLEGACASNARNLITPLTLPPYLECGVCKTCTEVNALVTTFNTTYCTPAQQPDYYYDYLARYLNEKLGLNRSAGDYKTFLDQCATAPPPTGCRILMLCPEELNPTLDASGNCSQILVAQAYVQAEVAYAEAVRAARASFVSQYLTRCLNNLTGEQFSATSPLLEYQYTLYYYDQSNLLTQTIPPAGVVPLNLDALGGNGQSNRNNIRANRANPTGPTAATYPAHTMPTRYAYNSLGRVVKQIAPDHLENRYYYDQVGRLVASQDGRQRPSNKYSYTLYDALGRVIQTGEGVNTNPSPATILSPAAFNSWFAGVGSKAHVTRTYYDISPISNTQLPISYPRLNQRSRVAASTIIAAYNASDDIYDYATHYSYDITGDVATIIQDIPELATNGHRHKRIDYDYDQLSGKVNAVFYQKGQADQFSYRYFYDLDNRLTQVMSSFTDTEPVGALWDREASYKYYLHGPLARTEIGHYRVQGMDYAYTLQGWIKGLNASFLNSFRDIGKDANDNASNANRYVGVDAFAYTLGFYNDVNSQSGSTKIKDYYPIGGGSGQMEVNYIDTGTDTAPFHTDALSQYTGNIRFIAKQTRNMTPNGATIQTYRYDQLMRLNSMNTYFPGSSALSSWMIRATGFTAPLQANYKESDITYDRNGNILTYRRWGSDVNVQDSLNYKYAGRNQLIRVTDQVAANSFSGDFDGQSPGNYIYDDAGNLITDAQGNASITWSPYGKVLQVSRAALASTTFFGYDAMQNRVKKQQTSLSSNISTYYVRDAQGNVLAVYEKNGTTITWKEQHLYGSSRLGTVEPGVAWTTTPAATPHFRGTRILNYGWKRYEVNDHLGNVRALINDRKTYGGATFTATLLDATDYFPFGAEMRKGTAPTASYRYGFNGKELDKNGEFGSLNHYDYGFRIYNPGIGRFLSVDPLTREYPNSSPYIYAGNNPVQFVDANGGLKIDPFFVRKYPNFAKMLKFWIPRMAQNNYAIDAWVELTGKTPKDFEDILAFGKGPYVTITRPENERREAYNQSLNPFFEPAANAGESGKYKDYQNVAVIKMGDVQAFEDALKSGNRDQIAETMLILSAVILHEVAHHGKGDNKNANYNYDPATETGARMEDLTFGERFSYRDWYKATENQGIDRAVIRAYYRANKETIKRARMNEMAMFPDYNGVLKNLFTKQVPVPEGQSGDPILIENGDIPKPNKKN